MSAAVDFLRRLHPDGPWALTAISVNKKSITTRTFGPGDEAGARAFIDEHNGRRNLYYALNPPTRALSKKSTRADIRAVVALHVDIDARAGEPLEDELARLRELSHGRPPEGAPPPTFIVYSGGGYQLIWVLAEPIPIDGDLAAAEDAARYNKRLELLYSADNCHNIDRVLRLPGTVNLPDARKRAKGRVEAEAEVSGHYPDRVYKIDKFERAPATAPSPGGGARGGAGDLPRVADLEELDKYNVAARIKIIIARGGHPDEPKGGDNSRSAWLFDAVCGLARAGVPDDVILAIITDPDWPISESVVELGGRAAAYARRQIERARETVAGDDAEFQTNESGRPAPNQHNIRVALRRLDVQLSHDKFADRLLVAGLPGHGPALQDEAVAALYLEVDRRFGFRPGKDFFWMVVEDQARRAAFNPVTDYLAALAWDGTARVDGWLTRYGGAEDTPYTRAVGALVLLAAVRRARAPGCKFDEMLVLVSPQGTDKSSALAALVPVADWFTDDLPLGADTKVVIERLAGRWIVEAAELKGMRDRRTEHLKAFLSRQVDRARMAYGRITREVPRQCVIIGTTNDERFLTDLTGNRRFWPVGVERLDVAALRRDRDQLWAEAAQREAGGESIRLDPALYGAATEAQQRHEHVNPFLEVLEPVLREIEGKLLSADAWAVLGVPVERRSQEQNDRLGAAMQHLGWERTKARFGRPQPEHCYARGGKPWRRVLVGLSPDGRWSASHEAPF